MAEKYNPVYLEGTFFFETQKKEIHLFNEKVILPTMNDVEKAIALYQAVRDGWMYNAYGIHLEKEKLKSSTIFKNKEGHCLDKAILLITSCRAAHIPARLGLAKIQNHIAVEKFVTIMNTNILTPHAYVELFLDNKWVKATPAFNKSLCKKLNILPLEFDGLNDSIFQQYNSEGSKFMEYLEDYGSFEDVPTDFIIKNMQDNYPNLEKMLSLIRQ
jgi:transglutaminase-like putative cysteine protease